MPSLNTGNAILSNAIAVDSSYNVGIGGAASGSNKLQVTGIASANSFIPTSSTIPSNGMYLSAANTLAFATNTGNRLTISSTGAATFSSSVTATSESSLFKEGYIIRATTTSGGGSQPAYTYYTAAGSKRWSSFLDVGSDKFHIANASNSELFTITQAGNVGIGTSSPQVPLHTNTASGENTLLIQAPSTSYSQIFLGDGATGDAQYAGYLQYYHVNNSLTFGTNSTPKMVITSGGNVGIGTSSPEAKLQVAGTVEANGSLYRAVFGTTVQDADMTGISGGNGSEVQIQSPSTTRGAFLTIGGGMAFGEAMGGIAFYNSNNVDGKRNRAFIVGGQEGATAGEQGSYLSFGTVANTVSVPSERMRITSGGYTKISNTGSYNSVGSAFHELRNNSNDNEVVNITHAGSSPYGISLYYVNATPNNGSNWFAYFGDSTAQRFSVRSNGGVYNYTGNNVPLSDQRMKKEITPLESYWNKFKEIEMVKFKYIDQDHDDFNIGVISQQIESIMPEFVDVWDDKNIPEDGKPLMGVYMEDLHNMTMKVLQEAMARIEEQQAQIEAQQQTINSLINR